MEQPTIHEEQVAFEVESVDVIGVLRVPLGARATAALVLAGPMTSVKEQATGNYAMAMAAREELGNEFSRLKQGRQATRAYQQAGR